MRPSAPALVPMYRTPLEPGTLAAEADAAWIAHRLFTRHGGEPVRGLEALALAEANRLRRERSRGGAYPKLPPAPDDARYRACLRIARRAVAGTLGGDVGGATHYHRANALPDWARALTPIAEIAGFVFYRRGADV